MIEAHGRADEGRCTSSANAVVAAVQKLPSPPNSGAQQIDRPLESAAVAAVMASRRH
jgi:hypothetical protein